MNEASLEGDFYDYIHARNYADRAWNQHILEYYVPFFAHCRQVLDVGCGEGQMLELLASAGVEASGIDADTTMVRVCRARGLQVEQANLFDFLPGHPAEFDGIFSSNLIEHLSAEQAVQFVNLAFQALKPGGVLLVATPNPESLIVHMHEFWRDATHVRLYHRTLLEFILHRAGFRNVASGENARSAWLLSQQPAAVLSAPQELRAGLGLRLASRTVWSPLDSRQGLAWWRRPARWLRRRLASVLARSVLFEELATIEQRLGELYSVGNELVAQAQVANAALRNHVHVLEEVKAASIAPLQRPREVFAVGIKSRRDEDVPGPLREAISTDVPAASWPPLGAEGAGLLRPATAGPAASAEQMIAQSEPSAKQGSLVRQYTGAPKIAVFTPYLPYPPDSGGKIRSYQLLRALAARFDVDLFSVYHGAQPQEDVVAALREFCCQVVPLAVEKPWRTRDRLRRALGALPRSVDFFHTADSLALAEHHLRTGEYDVVVADEICMSPYTELAPHLARVVARQKVDHLHYAEMAKARPWGSDRILDSLEALKLRRYERAKMPFYPAFIACSTADAQIIGRDAPDAQALVIPNGVDLDTFVPSGRVKMDEPILLFVGSMHYYPNIDAVRFFFEAMYGQIRQALPDVRVQIVGHSPPPEIQQLSQRPGVEVVGGVPDMRPYLEAATVFMVPLRLGGGTRLKIVEAMAMGAPVVSTTVGAEGLDIHPGQDILIADDADSFVGAVVRLFADAELRARLSVGGRRLAERYDWGKLMAPFGDLLAAMVKQRREEGH